MESVFQSAAKNFGKNRFSVDIPKKLWGCAHEYSAAFFIGQPACNSSVQTEEVKHTARFIQSRLYLCTDHNNDGTVTLHASEVQLESMTSMEIEHKSLKAIYVEVSLTSEGASSRGDFYCATVVRQQIHTV